MLAAYSIYRTTEWGYLTISSVRFVFVRLTQSPRRENHSVIIFRMHCGRLSLSSAFFRVREQNVTGFQCRDYAMFQ